MVICQKGVTAVRSSYRARRKVFFLERDPQENCYFFARSIGFSPSQLFPHYFLCKRSIGIMTTMRSLLGYEGRPELSSAGEVRVLFKFGEEGNDERTNKRRKGNINERREIIFPRHILQLM